MNQDRTRLALWRLSRPLLLFVVFTLISACGIQDANGTFTATTPSPANASPTTASSTVSPAPITATIVLSPDHGGAGSGVRITGKIDSARGSSQQLTVDFRHNPSVDHPDGTRASTPYHGPIWPSQWNVHLNAGGQFTLTVKIPRVLQQQEGDNLWLIEPGVHLISFDDGGRQLASAHFTVDATPPMSNTASVPEVVYQNLWPVNATTVWLTGERCQASSLPTPDAYGNQATPGPQTCQGLLEVSHKAGRSWTEQPLPDPTLIPQTISFTDASHGVLILTSEPSCGRRPCSSVIYLTRDGGEHWEAVYHTDPNTPTLIEHGQPVIAKSVVLTMLVFSNANDGWAYGTGCSDLNQQDCQPVLLVTNDGGGGWSQVGLPEMSCPCSSIAHPTTADGWIVTGSLESSTRIIVTHDGGQTWSERPDPAGENVFSQQIFFRSASSGWLLSGSEPGAGSQAKTLYQTTDGGQSWTEIASAAFGAQSHGLPSSGYAGATVFSTDQTGWIVSGRLGLLRSTDGGKHWAPVPSIGYQDSLQALRFSDAQHGWLLSSRQLWRTDDGGVTWTALSLPGVATQ